MFCPACQQPLHETAAVCAACGFTLVAADAAFGAPPLIEHPVTDPGGLLGRSGHSQVAQAAAGFERRFPQCQVTLLLLSKPVQAAARPWLFWVFNRGGLHRVVDKGGACRRFLLWIDPATPHLGAICGYGMEPLLPAQHLKECLHAAGDHAAAGLHARAACAFIRELEVRLTRLRLALPQTFGWADASLWTSLDDAPMAEREAEQQVESFAY